MSTKKFSSEFSSRGTVKVTDKLMITNIDTGATEYCTVAELLAALGISGNVGITGNITFANDTIERFIKSSVSGGAIRLRGNGGAATDRDVQLGRVDNDGVWSSILTATDGGNVIIGGSEATSKLQVVGLIEYADNAAAIAAGLTAGAFYRTVDVLKIVH